jgi:hypothetical protein
MKESRMRSQAEQTLRTVLREEFPNAAQEIASEADAAQRVVELFLSGPICDAEALLIDPLSKQECRVVQDRPSFPVSAWLVHFT